MLMTCSDICFGYIAYQLQLRKNKMQLLFFFCPYVACFGIPLRSSFQFFSMDVMGFCLLIKQCARWLHGRNFTTCVHKIYSPSVVSFLFHHIMSNIFIYMCVWDEKYAPARMSLLFSFLPVHLSSGHGERELFHLSFFHFSFHARENDFPLRSQKAFAKADAVVAVRAVCSATKNRKRFL